MARADIDFVEQLVRRYPQLLSIYAGHCQDYGDVLPHVLFGDFSRFIIIQSTDLERNRSFLESFMLAMEEAISGNDEYLANLVHVSFIENLMGERELIDCLAIVTSASFLQLIKDVTGYDLNELPPLF